MPNKKFNLLYSINSSPDVAAIEIGQSTGYISLQDLKRIVSEGIQDKPSDNNALVPTLDIDEPLDISHNKVCLTFPVSGSLKMHLSRLEAEQFLEDAQELLNSKPINER